MSGAKTLDEFVDSYTAVKKLKENLQANLDAITELDDETKETLMRCNLIMVRQCLEDFGAE